MNLKSRSGLRKSTGLGRRPRPSVAAAASITAAAVTTTAAIASTGIAGATMIAGVAVPVEPAVPLTGGIAAGRTIRPGCAAPVVPLPDALGEPAEKNQGGHNHHRQQCVLHGPRPFMALSSALIVRRTINFRRCGIWPVL